MRLWNTQDTPGKIDIIGYRIILCINPAAHKFRIQFRITCRCKVFRIYSIADHKHLNCRKNSSKFPLTDILFYLPESIHI